jgi:hypothetical protein
MSVLNKLVLDANHSIHFFHSHVCPDLPTERVLIRHRALHRSSWMHESHATIIKCLTPLSTPITITLPAEVAQLVEHLTENQGVTSSILVLGTGAKNHPAWGGLGSRIFAYAFQEPSPIDSRNSRRNVSIGWRSPSSVM